MTTKYYHGASVDFESPKLNGRGILWLTPHPKVAQLYGVKRNRDLSGNLFLWEITLRAGAKVVDIGDIKHPVIRALRDALDQSYYPPATTTDEEWVRKADFTTLESKPWVRGFLRKKRIDAVTCKDVWDTSDVAHDSLALLNLKAVDTMTKMVVPAGSVPSNKTLQEVSDWLKLARVVARFRAEL